MSTLRGALFVAEPPAHYVVRPPLVLDCSTLSGLVFEEDWQEEASRQIEGRSLKAPYLLEIEITSVALKKSRHGGAEIAESGLARYISMDIELFEVCAQEVYALAKRYQLSAYDAAYLWLAAELKAPLLIRPDEVLSRIFDMPVLKVANHPLGRLLQHRHMFCGRLT